MPLCGAGNLARPPFSRLFGFGKNPRARPVAGWKAGGSQDWLPRRAAEPQPMRDDAKRRHESTRHARVRAPQGNEIFAAVEETGLV
jgi:hypothetical protein